MILNSDAKSRRELLQMAAAGAAFVVALPLVASAAPEQVVAEIKKLYGEKKLTEGKIKLDLPSIAENGLVVPLNFEVESPMTDKDYVKAVHFFSEGNPNPLLASFQFTPLCPKASAAIRVRLANTQNIVAVAEMSNGDVYTARKEVKVTIGGCGG
jgi:sulfur-oxidizing protein SoxY